jgi:Ca2+-binding RTX toxin-like protein
MLIKATTKTGLGVQYTLGGNNDLLVGKGVTVRSIDNATIFATIGQHEVTVAGTVVGDNSAINIDSNANGQKVSILKGGALFAEGYGALIGGLNSVFVNRGTVTSGAGIIFTAEGDGVARASNFGSIMGGGIRIGGMNDGQRSVIRNAGLIAAPDDDAVDGSQVRDLVINTGRIQGDLDLNGGNDRYVGLSGEVFGVLRGGSGNDVFVAGKAPEVFDGGADSDLVDYRGSGSVALALDAGFASGKAARFDTFDEIERVFGSALGSDRIRGDDVSNDLRGFGGADTLLGRGGNDTLVGGAGKDLIDASEPSLLLWADRIIYNDLSEGGDRISGFYDLDRIAVKGSAFKGGLALGGLIEERFKAGGNNRAAEADDRFIWRNGDDTLWFDRDGTGTAFKPVLLADFADGTVFNFNNITVF